MTYILMGAMLFEQFDPLIAAVLLLPFAAVSTKISALFRDITTGVGHRKTEV